MPKDLVSTSPFLFQFAVNREGSTEMPGHYDSSRNVWVVNDNGTSTPLIEKAENVAELATKTKAQVEGEDMPFTITNELRTKTEAQRKRDDEAQSIYSSLLMLITKTCSAPERDD
ncbi:hypothetical protein, partial [Terasakiella pusilla]|uniref:hypothetical protein n=1 Tax=Terasakiella pusilla TaxID=64973 RepID=UPI00057122F4